LLRNLIRRVLCAVDLIFDFELQTQPGSDALGGFEGHSDKLGHALLSAMNGEANGGDGTEQRHGNQYREEKEKPKQTPQAIAHAHGMAILS
jgi:hypothetical protein